MALEQLNKLKQQGLLDVPVLWAVPQVVRLSRVEGHIVQLPPALTTPDRETPPVRDDRVHGNEIFKSQIRVSGRLFYQDPRATLRRLAAEHG